MPGNKMKLFFEARQVFIAYIGKQILPFASRQGIITSSDTKTTGQPLLQAEAKKPFSQALHTAYESSFWKVSFSMNETVTKRFLLYFRLMMVAWILIANAFFHAIEFEYSWLVFLSNIMLFTMEGDIKDRFISVEEMQHTWRETSFLLFYPIVARKNGRIYIKVQRPGIFAAGAL